MKQRFFARAETLSASCLRGKGKGKRPLSIRFGRRLLIPGPWALLSLLSIEKLQSNSESQSLSLSRFALAIFSCRFESFEYGSRRALSGYFVPLPMFNPYFLWLCDCEFELFSFFSCTRLLCLSVKSSFVSPYFPISVQTWFTGDFGDQLEPINSNYRLNCLEALFGLLIILVFFDKRFQLNWLINT